MKVGVEYNQVEIALQALNGSTEEVIFGAASLRDKQKKIYSCSSFSCLQDPSFDKQHHPVSPEPRTWIW